MRPDNMWRKGPPFGEKVIGVGDDRTVPLKSCGILLFEQSGGTCRFLLMRHADRWDLPKGHVDPGESEIECALREFEEETSIPRERIDLDAGFRFEHHYRVPPRKGGGAWRDKTLVVFLGRLLDPHPVEVSEHIGYEWFDWSPPHHIQAQTIDPLLEAVATYAREQRKSPCASEVR